MSLHHVRASMQIVLFSAKHPTELRKYLAGSRWRHHVVPGGAGSAAKAAAGGAGSDGALAAAASSGSSSSSSSAPAALATPRIRIVTAPGVASSGDALRAVDAMSLIRSDVWLLVDGPGWLTNAHLGAAVASHSARNKADTNAVMTVLLSRLPSEPSAAAALRGDARRVTRISMTPHDGKIHGYDVLDAAEALAAPKTLTSVPSKTARAEPTAVARTDLLDTRAYVCSGAVLVHFSDNYDYGSVRDAYLHGEVLNVDMGFAFHGHLLTDAFAAPVDSLAALAAATREVLRRRVHPFVPSANWAEDAAAALGGRSEHLRAPWRVTGPTREALVQEGAVVDASATARMVGPVLVGAGAAVSARAVLEGAVVIGPGASIGEGARIRDAIIMTGAQVGSGAVIASGAVIGAGAVIGDKATVGAGAVIGAGVHVPSGHCLPAHARVTAAALPADVDAAAAAACSLPAGGKGRLWPAPGEDGEDDDDDADDDSDEDDEDDDEDDDDDGKAAGKAGVDGANGASRAAAAGAAAAALASALSAYRAALAAYRDASTSTATLGAASPAADSASPIAGAKVSLARALTALTAAVRAALAHRRLCVGPALEPLWPSLAILLTPLAAASAPAGAAAASAGAAGAGAGVATLSAPMTAKEASDVLATAAAAGTAKPAAASAAAAAAATAAGGAGAGAGAAVPSAADAAAAAVEKFRRFAVGVADLLCGRAAASGSAAAAAGDAAAGGAGAGAGASTAAVRAASATSPDIVRNLTMEVKSFKYAEHASFGDCVHACLPPVIEAIPGAPPAPSAPEAAVKAWYMAARGTVALWAPMLTALVNSTGDEMAVLLALEQHVLRAPGDRAAALHPLFGLLLQLLYDEDVVSDIAVQAWAFSAEDDDEGEADDGEDEEEAAEGADAGGKRGASGASGAGVIAKSATTIDGAIAAASAIYGVKLTGPEARAARAGLLKGRWTQRLLEKLEEEEEDDDDGDDDGDEESEEDDA